MSDGLSLTGPFPGNTEAEPAALTVREERFVAAIVTGQSIADGATAAGVSYRTGKRWRHRDQIVRAIRARTNETLGQARAVLAAGARSAAESLVAMATGTRKASTASVMAARAVLEGATRLIELDELSARLDALEVQTTEYPCD